MTFAEAAALTAIVAVGTYLLRAGPALLLADRDLPMPVQRALRNVGPSVLAALVVVSVAGGEGGGVEVAEVVALVAAGAVAWWRRNLIWSLLAGMAALWIALWLG